MEEVQMPQQNQSVVKKEEKAKAPGAPKKKLSDKIKNNPKMRDMTEDEMAAYLEWEENRIKTISTQIVEYFPQVMIFHTMIVGITAIRAPTDFACSCTYFAMMMRIIMVVGYYANKKIIYVAASGMEIFINFILLFTAMSYSQYKTDA